MKLDSQNNTKFPNRVIKRAHEINWKSGVAYCFVFFGVYCANNHWNRKQLFTEVEVSSSGIYRGRELAR